MTTFNDIIVNGDRQNVTLLVCICYVCMYIITGVANLLFMNFIFVVSLKT